MSEEERLRAEIVSLKRTLTFQRDRNHERNVSLDALRFVWCDGGCRSGVHRFTHGELTEEIVIEAERNTRRLRRWWEVKKFREKNPLPSSEG